MGPYRSVVLPYLSERAETQRLLERSACLHWCELATLELLGHPPHPVVGALDSGTGPKSDHGHEALARRTDSGPAHGPSECAPTSHGPRTVVLPLEFSRRKLGELRLQLLPHLPLASVDESVFAELAFRCACTIHRLASQRWMAQAQLGAPCLIGSSAAMSALDSHIEESCADARPVALLGPTGNEALQTAVAIHHGGGAGRTFVKVDCAASLEPPWRWVERARGGTLFLCNTDCGSPADQEHLWLQLERALSQSARLLGDPATLGLLTADACKGACRLVVALKAPQWPDSTGCPIPYGAWSRHTWKVITLPLLSQRTEDIPVLARAVLDYHGHGAERRMTDALQHWCTNYTWPGNASQLEWTVARMAVLTADTPIGASDINRLAPRLLGDAAPVHAPAGPHAPHQESPDAPAERQASHSAMEQPVDHWVRCVLDRDTQAFAHMHAGMARALMHLCTRFHEPISAEQLADLAHVSLSHLRFLFRDSLGLPFKLFLQRVRIAHAKRLLLDSPQRRITDVALSAGFNDFSHFQKCFRQIVGQTPGDLRRSASAATPLGLPADR